MTRHDKSSLSLVTAGRAAISILFNFPRHSQGMARGILPTLRGYRCRVFGKPAKVRGNCLNLYRNPSILAHLDELRKRVYSSRTSFNRAFALFMPSQAHHFFAVTRA